MTASGEGLDGLSSSVVSVGKAPKSRKPRRKKRMLTGVSRQRRAANARERVRIQGVNQAFLDLKNHIPVIEPEEVSKMDTLRLAAKWIAHLTTLLLKDDQQNPTRRDSSDKRQSDKLQEQLVDLIEYEVEDFELVEETRGNIAYTPDTNDVTRLPGFGELVKSTRSGLNARHFTDNICSEQVVNCNNIPDTQVDSYYTQYLDVNCLSPASCSSVSSSCSSSSLSDFHYSNQDKYLQQTQTQCQFKMTTYDLDNQTSCALADALSALTSCAELQFSGLESLTDLPMDLFYR